MVSGLAAAALAAGLSYGMLGAGDPAEPAAATPAAGGPADAPLLDTTWQLVSVERGRYAMLARPNLDITLRLDPAGRFLIRSCNNVFGDSRPGEATVLLAGAANTYRPCAGMAEPIDAALHEAANGWLDWAVDDGELTLTRADLTLTFRAEESGQPPVDTTPILDLEDGPVRCRAVVGGSGEGLRLYALANPKRGGPWRLLPAGPAAPGDGPMLSKQLEQKVTGHACVLGLAPPGTAVVEYRSKPGATAVPLEVHAVEGSETPAYSGVILRRDTGRLTALDAAGTRLVSWPTRR